APDSAFGLKIGYTAFAPLPDSFFDDPKAFGENPKDGCTGPYVIPSNMEHFQNGTEEGELRRQAISMAIDRKALCEKVLSGTGTP
ncbi:ABC transporter substrate-binding protein, partial [Bifidobacterium pullorum subsp. saeculare]|nr:ABC transporter substrate-binding protein [Bifidobacterium pullorum subsp. saeculare]